MICKKIVADIGASPPGYGVVRAGDGVRRLITPHGSAEACFASYLTDDVVHVPKIKEEEERGYAVVYAEDATGKYVFVWPGDVYRWVMDGAEAVFEGRRRATPMYILAGAPGSGKTTLASVVLPGKFGVPYEVHSPSSYLSKWVGETEKNIQRIFDRARSAQPYLVAFDEGDMLISREVSAGGGSGEGEVAKNAQAVLKVTTSEIYNRRERVLTIVSTNLSKDDILPEFQRRGRGVLVEVPYLPTDGLRILVDRLSDLHGVRCPGVDVVGTVARRKMSPADLSEWMERLAKDCRAPPPQGLSKVPDTLLSRAAGKRVRVICTDRSLCASQECPTVPGVHYAVEEMAPHVDVDDVAAVVIRHLIENCNAPPVVLMELERDKMKQAVSLARASRSPLVVYVEVDTHDYFAYFAKAKDIPVIFLQPHPSSKLPKGTYIRGAIRIA